MFEDDDLDLDFSQSVVSNTDREGCFVKSVGSRNLKQEQNANFTNLLSSFQSKPLNSPSNYHSAATGHQPSSLLPLTKESKPRATSSNTNTLPESPSPISSETDVMRRKFPGPAGLVSCQPPHAGDKRPVVDDHDHEDLDFLAKRKTITNTNGLDNHIEMVDLENRNIRDCVLWKKALEEIMIMLDGGSLKYNISWIKKQSAATIVPHFVCKIAKLDTSFKDPVLLLRDHDAVIEGNLHRDIIEAHGRDIKVGTVLIVVRVAILKTVKKSYLNLTLNNIVSIYSSNEVKNLRKISKREIDTIQRRSEETVKTIGQSCGVDLSSRNNFRPPTFGSPGVSQVPRRDDGAWNNSPLLMPREGSGQPVSSSPSNSSSSLAAASKTRFTFKSRSNSSFKQGMSAVKPCASDLVTQESSQCLVASLLSDLDSSDIWTDF